ncbi:Multiple RNA-binding domain-containing protein 1 [Maudiozyma exigua]|uniref:Multiple RNA-binding domain-containing protein 1 n=1 Tax=Maudiozyma exigua TaxID=34358 RepID=A0A9P6WA87_MAUEX|nr:Multiple RNA-binding domain-containing protein 1 [Kazachstania exigua]
MSRIIVKGLPIYLSDDQLKEHFNKRLLTNHESSQIDNLITDVKIVRDRNGQSRRFAFLGYKNEADARDAIGYFNGSYINTAKLQVNLAKSFADPTVPQAMKEKKREAYKRMREREENLLQEANSKKHRNNDNGSNRNHSDINSEIRKNKQLQEFIETMKPSSKVTSWEQTGTVDNAANGSESIHQGNVEGIVGNSLLAQALAIKDDDDEDDTNTKNSDDEYEALDSNGKDEEEKDDEPMMSLDQVNTAGNEKEEEGNDDNKLAQDAGVSDSDWLKQRRVRIREGESEPAKPSKDISSNSNEETKKTTEVTGEQIAEPERSAEEVAMEKIKLSGRLFLRNILYSATEQDFRQLFEPFGQLTEVHVALDTRTGQSKGFAYVQFNDPEDAIRAYIELDKQIFQGRLIHILPADVKNTHRLDEFDLKNMPLKKQRELKKKAQASKQTFAWNSLYMNQDAVLSSVASKLGMQKSDLIDAENSNSAVKQALAEAHVIGDVRKYFENKGVDLTKFGNLKSPDQRDDCVILVKNFPYGTTREDLGELFLPFGKLERFLMPPAGTIAIVQYRDRTAARAAFTKLSFKRYKDGIIYLEKGQKDCFTREANNTDENLAESEKTEEPAKEAKASVNDLMETPSTETKTENDISVQQEEEDDSIADGPTVSIFIKNLNFTTTSPELSDRFKKFNGFVVAQVKTKPNPKDKNKPLSMGFGFAEFRTKEQANAVISAMDGSVIDGHKIQLKLSHRQGNNNNNASGKKKSGKSGKIIVKNLPFEATRKDVFELFSSFGQLKSVRVPKKFDKSARGFAFVEFLLPKEAENAMDQLQGVHLLGRRLVMQYAQQDAEDAEEEIARMTKKVKKQAATTALSNLKSGGGRKRLDMDEDNDDGLDGF